MEFFLSNLSQINVDDLVQNNKIIVGLDIGDKTVGVAISDRRIKIATGLTTIQRKNLSFDYKKLSETLCKYNVGTIIFGWPIQMNGQPGAQCEKVLKFVQNLPQYFDTSFVRWDERLSTCATENVLIQANLSRKKRKEIIDKNAATYILQGALDFLNRFKNTKIS